MKLEKTDMEVLTQLVKDVKKEYSMKQLADLLKKPYVKVHSSIKRLEKSSIIKKRIMGKSHYCRIDYKNNLDVVGFAEAQRARNFLAKRKDIKVLIDNIKEKIHFPDYSLIIFGSFAKNTATKTSDLDMVFFTSEQDKKQAENILNAVSRTSLINLHAIEVTYMELIEMLKAKEITVGKEIATNHIIIHGCEQFYECIRLAE